MKLGSAARSKKTILAVLLVLGAGPAHAQNAEFQLGYVFNGWTSNFIASGQESRIPASLRFTAGDLSLTAESSFVLGDYVQAAYDTTPASTFKASQFSDTTFSASMNFGLGPSLVSSLSGRLNIPTGSTAWESQSESGSIPFLFEPSFYHGRGWGGSFYWGVASTQEVFQWGAGAGYLLTTTYDVGIAGESAFNPGDSLLLMGSLGGKLSDTEKLSFRAIHAFAFQSKIPDPAFRFTPSESTVVSGQWLARMGSDRLALNASYSFYSRGMVADPITNEQVLEDGNFLGDRLEVRPVLGYQAGPGVALETGFVWKRIFKNGYPSSDTGHFQAGGDLWGAEQSVTFRVDSGMFLNFAGLYHLILNEKAAWDDSYTNLTNVIYNRFTFGTNVGFKW
jgi:hypothetical protein